MVLNKISDGELPDATLAMGNWGFLIDMNAEAFINGDLSTTNQKVIIDSSLSIADITSSEWTYDEQNAGHYGDILVDQVDDSSVDTDIWSSSGSMTENTSYIQVTSAGGVGTHTITLSADQASAPDFKTFSGDSKVLVVQQPFKNTGAANFSSSWQVIIGSTEITTQGLAGGGDPVNTIIIFFDKTAETCSVYTKDGSTLTADVDISGEANWYVTFQAKDVSGGATGTTSYRCLSFSYITDSSVVTPEIITASDTMSESATAMYIYLFGSNISQFTTLDVSADATNYVSFTHKSIVNISDSGTTARIKINSSIPSSLTNDNSYEAFYFSGYLIFYDG